MQALPLDRQSGFRRRFRITPMEGRVCSEVEDDYHCMRVTLYHNGKNVTSVEPVLARAPWTTCPGAEAELKKTFTGVPLDGFAARGEKSTNCTHLYDLALLAAAHAFDDSPLVYDILVSDPAEDGLRHAELRRNGVAILGWSDRKMQLVEPAELAGTTLDKMRPWINALDPALREGARLLQWGNMIANGRSIPMERQSDASRMPSTCYTFQPERKTVAVRVGLIRDFSDGTAQPLDGRQAVH